jgi:hypothetical protein
MSSRTKFLPLLALALVALPAFAQVNTLRYKDLYPTLSAAERATYEQALAAELKAAQARWNEPHGPVQGDLCTAPNPTPVNPFNVSSTTVGATNNYDIATVCATPGQTLFGGTGAALDVAFGVMVDANCTVNVSADPTGASWDLAVYVLQAPGAACTQLPSLADGQCIVMDDNGGGDVTELLSWPATVGTEYFVIIDGFNAATGTFDLAITGTGCNLVPVELQKFSVDR